MILVDIIVKYHQRESNPELRAPAGGYIEKFLFLRFFISVACPAMYRTQVSGVQKVGQRPVQKGKGRFVSLQRVLLQRCPPATSYFW